MPNQTPAWAQPAHPVPASVLRRGAGARAQGPEPYSPTQQKVENFFRNATGGASPTASGTMYGPSGITEQLLGKRTPRKKRHPLLVLGVHAFLGAGMLIGAAAIASTGLLFPGAFFLGVSGLLMGTYDAGRLVYKVMSLVPLAPLRYVRNQQRRLTEAEKAVSGIAPPEGPREIPIGPDGKREYWRLNPATFGRQGEPLLAQRLQQQQEQQHIVQEMGGERGYTGGGMTMPYFTGAGTPDITATPSPAPMPDAEMPQARSRRARTAPEPRSGGSVPWDQVLDAVQQPTTRRAAPRQAAPERSTPPAAKRQRLRRQPLS